MDGRTDGQNYDSQDRASIAVLSGKKWNSISVINANINVKNLEAYRFTANLWWLL